jgi:hypothetical protein
MLEDLEGSSATICRRLACGTSSSGRINVVDAALRKRPKPKRGKSRGLICGERDGGCRTEPLRSRVSRADGRCWGDIVLDGMDRGGAGKRKERPERSMNDCLEDEICRRGESADGTSAAGVLFPTRWGGAMISWGNSPKIWLNFLACLNCLCITLSSRSFVVGGSGIDRDIDDRVVLPREEHEVLGDIMELQGETCTRGTRQ